MTANGILVADVLRELAKRRPIFHSEGDFRHAFASEVQRQLPDALVRAEVPLRHAGTRRSLDVCAVWGKTILAVELKYSTTKLGVMVHDERFELIAVDATRGAVRYGFVKDIQRLEEDFSHHRLGLVFPGRERTIGYAILLTNVSAFWEPWIGYQGAEPLRDEAFRLHEGRVLEGALSWHELTGAGTKENMEAALQLSGSYRIHWQDYGEPVFGKYGQFRCLAVRVGT